MTIEAVIFDLGGVVLESPLRAVARYERDAGLAAGAVNRAVAAGGAGGAWARLERGELSLETFYGLFEAESRAEGVLLDGRRLMAYIAEAGVTRPPMIEAVRRIRIHGLRTAALTNNWIRPAQGPNPLRDRFDVFIESSRVGLRKPDPRIYELACRELAAPPARIAFLDDIGANLKAARRLGMTTIKVDDPDVALRELAAVLGFALAR